MSAAYYVCTTKVYFPATEAPGVPGVPTKSRFSSHGSSACPRTTKSRLSSHGSSGCPRRTIRLYYKRRLSSHGSSACPRAYYVCTTKSRLSSHGSSACPWRTTFVLQKSTFQPRKLRVSPAYYTSVLQKSTFQPRKLRVSAAYYVCTTKSRLSSHGSSACPRRTTFVLQKSIVQPRKSPAYYVCTTQVDKKTQKHYGFRAATTRKPAEGLRLHVKKRKSTMVLAPRQRRNPQRGYVCMSQNAKTRLFWHCANAETRRGLSAATKKSTKHDGFSAATRRLPAEGCPRTQRNIKKRRF